MIRCIVCIKIAKDILKSPEIMLNDLRVPVSGFIVTEGGVKYAPFTRFLTPGSGIFALQIERNIGGLGFARFPFLFRRDCFDFTVIIMGILLR